jgi:hypothetical protein
MDINEMKNNFVLKLLLLRIRNLGNIMDWTINYFIKGTRNWLAAFGFNILKHRPSDLEYDPRVSVVAKWRDRNSLQRSSG